nr:MAG TPA: hypothetical protein [Caudoviricetes sp.]
MCVQMILPAVKCADTRLIKQDSPSRAGGD